MRVFIALTILSLSLVSASCTQEESDWYWREKQECFNKFGTSTYYDKTFTCRSTFEYQEIIYQKRFEKDEKIK